MATRKVTKRSKTAPAAKPKVASASKATAGKAKRAVDPFERALAAIGTTQRKDVPSNIDRQTRVQSGLQSLRKRLKATTSGAPPTARGNTSARMHWTR